MFREIENSPDGIKSRARQAQLLFGRQPWEPSAEVPVRRVKDCQRHICTCGPSRVCFRIRLLSPGGSWRHALYSMTNSASRRCSTTGKP
jgi:hypothetical protein